MIKNHKAACETWNLLTKEDRNGNPSPFRSIVVSHGVNPFASDVCEINQEAVDFLRQFADALENKKYCFNDNVFCAPPKFYSPLHTPSHWVNDPPKVDWIQNLKSFDDLELSDDLDFLNDWCVYTANEQIKFIKEDKENKVFVAPKNYDESYALAQSVYEDIERFNFPLDLVVIGKWAFELEKTIINHLRTYANLQVLDKFEINSYKIIRDNKLIHNLKFRNYHDDTSIGNVNIIYLDEFQNGSTNVIRYIENLFNIEGKTTKLRATFIYD